MTTANRIPSQTTVTETVNTPGVSITNLSAYTVQVVTHLVITNTRNVDIIKCVIRSSRSNTIKGSHEVVNKILTVQIQTISIYVVQE